VLAAKPSEGHALVGHQTAGLAAAPVPMPRLLDLKVFTYGFLTDGSWQAHGVIIFESMRPCWHGTWVMRAQGLTPNPAMTQRLSRSRSQTYLKLKACASCTNTIAARCLQTE
jgi:hypothetical protein